MKKNTETICMKSFSNIYKILKRLDDMLDLPEADSERISAKTLGITELRRARYLIMLENGGYIEGLKVFDEDECDIGTENIHITLKGIKWLAENAALIKAANIIKEVGVAGVTAAVGAVPNL